jgi:SecD/SecF fusion protein
VIAVPSGVVVLKDERAGYWVLADKPELTNADITDPKQAFDPQTDEPIVTFGFTDKGRQAFARVTKREARRGAQIVRRPGTPLPDTFQSFGIALDNQLVSRAVIDYQQNPNGIPGDTGAQINGLGDIGQTQQIARSMASRPLTLDLVRIGSR